MKADPQKVVGLVGSVLGLYVAVATVVSDAKVLPGLFWIGFAVISAAGFAGVVLLLWVVYGFITEEVMKRTTPAAVEKGFLWMLAIAAAVGAIGALATIGNPGASEAAKHFGFTHVVGLVALVGGALLMLALHHESTNKHDTTKPPT